MAFLSVLQPRQYLRLALTILFVVSSATVTAGWLTHNPTAMGNSNVDDLAVITTQGAGAQEHNIQTSGRQGELVAVAPNGSVVYRNSTYHDYWDVDPVEGTESTVMYSASQWVPSDKCEHSSCFRMVVESLNLSTRAVTRHFTRVTWHGETHRYHDVDFYNETHIIVADIEHDRVFIADTRTNDVTWAWNFSSEYSRPGNGWEKGDWTHVNDVEVLDGGRIMLSPRNFNRILFIRPGEGVLHDQTLGSQNNTTIMKGQHNPDYIPAENGGPAILIADSLNHRIVEYQRNGGEWTRSWTWKDTELQWPRDADRLPGGHTLITDTNANRIIQVNDAGRIIWSFEINRPYEAERLETGDESTGGAAAAQLGLETKVSPDALSQLPEIVREPVGRAINGIFFVAPMWFGRIELAAGIMGVLSLLGLLSDGLIAVCQRVR